jgi:hypothetical protein
MDITCKKKSEALAHLNQFWSKFPFLSHYNSVGVLVGICLLLLLLLLLLFFSTV